jgi:diguanylate cyclase (GGDEF)-like protein
MVTEAGALNDELLAYASRVGVTIRRTIAWGAVGGIMLSVLAAFLATLAISRPVQRLQRRMVALAGDPLAGEVGELDRHDELGDMAHALQLFVDTIRERENRLKDANTKLSVAHRELEKAATVDALTELWNRRKLDEVFAQHVVVAQRYGTPLAVIMLDVDTFKVINDTYGHQVGDSVLREAAGVLRAGVRETDWVGRWGGEEFMVICPNTTEEAAWDLAERVRQRIAGHDFPVIGRMTCSLGITAFRSGDRGNTMVKRADEALYLAKQNGRNRTERDHEPGQAAAAS